MGNIAPDRKVIEYSRFIDSPEVEGETKLFRNPYYADGPLPTRSVEAEGFTYTMQFFHRSVKNHPDYPFVGTRKHIKGEEFGEFEFKSYKEINELVLNFKYAIEKLQLCPKVYIEDHKKEFKFLGICGINTEEWVVSEIASLDNAVTVACIIESGSIELICNETMLETLQCDSTHLKVVIDLLKAKKLPHLKNVIVVPFYSEEKAKIDENIAAIKSLGINAYYHSEIIEIGAQYRKEKEGQVKFDIPDLETCNFLIYTSGSTGEPKGAMLLNKTQFAQIKNIDLSDRKLTPESVKTLFYLPLGHNYGQWVFMEIICFASRMGIFSGSSRRILEDCRKFNPISVPGVPRVFERIVTEVENNVKKLSPFMQRLYKVALKIKLDNYEKYNVIDHWLLDPLIFNKVNNIVGKDIKAMMTSSAPAQKNVLNKIRVLLKIGVTDAYGSTEANGIIATVYNTFRDIFSGGAYGSYDCKLIDVPELNYFVTDKNPTTGKLEPRGELLVRGPPLIPGYFRNNAITNEVFDKDGFYHTGDIVTILNGRDYINAVKIIDRRKNFFKLSQGEFIVPDKIQSLLTKSRYVDILCVVGKGTENYLVAIISPKKDGIVSYFNENGNKEVNADNVVNYYEDPKLLEAIIKDCEEIGRSGGLKGYELIKKCYLTKEPFSEKNTMLTNLGKIRPIQIKKIYEKEINAMYGIKG